MKDGSRYEGEFVDGEITGRGERTYPDGSLYNGAFKLGEKHGYGEVTYVRTGEWYKGEWNLNIRQGQGTLFSKDKNTYTGDFKNHWPNGTCTVLFQNGSHYHGDVSKGVMHGQGKLSQPFGTENVLNCIYQGSFEQGQKHGAGKMHVENGSFTLESNYITDQPEYEGTHALLRLPKQEIEEDSKVDLKAAKKPDPKAAPPKAEEEKVGEVKNKIVYEIGKENNAIDFEIHIIHQGASYEDPNPPAVEEKQAAPVKGGKAPAPGKPADDAKPEIRMITPDPVLMTNESGRTFEFELGRFEKHTASQEALDETTEK